MPDMRMRFHALYIRRLKRSRLRAAFHERIASEVKERFGGGWVVDVGCGPGLLGGRLGRQLPGARILGVDMDGRMLQDARVVRPMEVLRANVAALPFRSGSLGLAVSSASLKDWGHPEAGLREIDRCLRPGGQALVYDFLTAGREAHPAGFRRRFGLTSAVLARMASAVWPFTLDDVQRILRAADLSGEPAVVLLPELGAVCLEWKKPG